MHVLARSRHGRSEVGPVKETDCNVRINFKYVEILNDYG